MKFIPQLLLISSILSLVAADAADKGHRDIDHKNSPAKSTAAPHNTHYLTTFTSCETSHATVVIPVTTHKVKRDGQDNKPSQQGNQDNHHKDVPKNQDNNVETKYSTSLSPVVSCKTFTNTVTHIRSPLRHLMSNNTPLHRLKTASLLP